MARLECGILDLDEAPIQAERCVSTDEVVRHSRRAAEHYTGSARDGLSPRRAELDEQAACAQLPPDVAQAARGEGEEEPAADERRAER